MTMTPADPVDAGVTADAETVWTNVLQDYRATLDDQRHLLGRVHDDQDIESIEGSATFTPPADLPPMPPSLRDEAIALDHETVELLSAAREVLAQLKPPNSAPMHRSILAPPSPSQMDTRL